jgi:hypothetical protein
MNQTILFIDRWNTYIQGEQLPPKEATVQKGGSWRHRSGTTSRFHIVGFPRVVTSKD